MSKSVFQDFATDCVIQCAVRGNKARWVNDERTLDLNRSKWVAEFSTNSGKRVDLFAWLVYDDAEGHTLEETYAFEMKSCIPDICTGYGMNLVGDRNYVVIPSEELAEQLGNRYVYLRPENVESRLYDIDRLDVGIIEVMPNGLLSCWKAAGSMAIELWMRPLFLAGYGDDIADEAGLRIRDTSIRISRRRQQRAKRRSWQRIGERWVFA